MTKAQSECRTARRSRKWRRCAIRDTGALYRALLLDRHGVRRHQVAVLWPQAWPVWLGEEPADPRQLKALLAPYPSDTMTCWPVSQRVGSVKNNDPSLIEPIAVGA
jgi:hypothetical protein